MEEIKLLGPAMLPMLRDRLAARKDHSDRLSGMIESLILEAREAGGSR